MASSWGANATAADVLAGRDLSGRSWLVTGCNSGIGFETARALAAHGAEVVLGCRDLAKAQGAAHAIRALHPQASLTPLALDLGSFAGIRAACASFPLDVLHGLVCNAGLYSTRYAQTVDGIERTVGVCHFGHFLLVKGLLDRLRKGAPARVVMVSSESHRYPARLSLARFPLDADHFRPLVAYGQAKLCNVLFANELTRRHQHEGIYANALHPGALIYTSIPRESLRTKLLFLAARPFTKSVAQGAATSVYCATAPELERVGGRYFKDCREAPMSQGAADPRAAEQLWKLSEARVRMAHEPKAAGDAAALS